MTLRTLSTGAVAMSLCLALAGPAWTADPKTLPPTALPGPVVAEMKLVETPSLLVVGDSHTKSWLIVPALLKGKTYKVVVTYQAPLDPTPKTKAQAQFRGGPHRVKSASAAGQVTVQYAVPPLGPQTKVLSPATQAIGSITPPATPTKEWVFVAESGGQHVFTAKIVK